MSLVSTTSLFRCDVCGWMDTTSSKLPDGWTWTSPRLNDGDQFVPVSVACSPSCAEKIRDSPRLPTTPDERREAAAEIHALIEQLQTARVVTPKDTTP